MCLRVLKESKKGGFDRYSRQKQCIDHNYPILPFRIVACTFFRQPKIAVYSLWNNSKVSCNILCGLFEFINWMNSKKRTHFFNDKSGSLLYCWKFKYFLLISFSFTNKYKTFWFIFQHPWAISLKITVHIIFVLLVMFLIIYFFGGLSFFLLVFFNTEQLTGG